MEQIKSYKRGILAKPRHEPDTSKFKLVVWYEQKPNGEFYSDMEKKAGKNRKYHDSIDFILSTSGYITRHDEALNKLLRHLEKYKERIINALLFMNDFANDKQFLIGKFSKDENKSQFIQPEFTHYQVIQYKQKTVIGSQSLTNDIELHTNQVFCTGLIGAPLAEYKLKHHSTL